MPKKWIAVFTTLSSSDWWHSVKVEGTNEEWQLGNGHTSNDAERLAADLNELEAYRALGTPEELTVILDERRWRVIGEEWPEDGQECQLRVGQSVYPRLFAWEGTLAIWVDGSHTCSVDATGYYDREDYRFTHWRPAPTDTPTPVAVKEEG